MASPVAVATGTKLPLVGTVIVFEEYCVVGSGTDMVVPPKKRVCDHFSSFVVALFLATSPVFFRYSFRFVHEQHR